MRGSPSERCSLLNFRNLNTDYDPADFVSSSVYIYICCVGGEDLSAFQFLLRSAEVRLQISERNQ
jgi:hypothetical protein